jgi:hypothetical protein
LSSAPVQAVANWNPESGNALPTQNHPDWPTTSLQGPAGGMNGVGYAATPQQTPSQMPPGSFQARHAPTPNGQEPPKPFDAKQLIGPAVAGVAGLGAIAGVVAVSVMKHPNSTKAGVPQTTQQPPVQTVKGAMTLQVPDASIFTKDLMAQKAVAAGIADAARVKPESVVLTVVSREKSRLLAASKTIRHLVQLVYKVITSAVDSTQTAAAIKKVLCDKSASDMTTAVQSRLVMAKGADYRVFVTTFQAGKCPVVVAKTPSLRVFAPSSQQTLPPFEMKNAATTRGKNAIAHGAVSTIQGKTTTAYVRPTTASHGVLGMLDAASHHTVMRRNATADMNMTTDGSFGSLNIGNNGFWIGIGGICAAWVLFICCVTGVFFLRKKQSSQKGKPSKDSFMSATDTETSDCGSPETMSLMSGNDRSGHFAAAVSDTESQCSQYMRVESNVPKYAQGQQQACAQPAGSPVPVALFQTPSYVAPLQGNGLLGINLPKGIYG